MDDHEAFREQLRALVARSSQQQVADMLGTSQPQVSRWLRGVAVPSTQQVEALARVLGVEADALAGTLHRAREDRGTPDVERRLAAIERTVAELRDQIAELVRRLA